MTTASSSEWVLVGGYVALTLQLLRLAMDLVQVAASKATPANNKASSNKTTKSYGSMESGASSKEGISSTASTNDAEQQSLLGTSSSDEEDISESRTHKLVRLYGFLAVYSILLVFFLLAVIKQAAMTTSHDVVYPTALLVLTAFCILLEMLLLVRNVDKSRYGTLQRFLQLLTGLDLWVLYAILLKQHAHSIADVILLGAVTVHVILAVVDRYLARQLPQVIRRETGTSKKRLSRKAILTLLKPYFWPDKTEDCSAMANRLRAIVTWLCVIGSKVCGLFSPLYLGWATTSLAHSDYASTIRNVVLYSVVSFLGTTLKEGQSLVYLKVAQAAFVQLSETAFSHLHSLSLDWHLRKKLGEVLRSMDRGIAACDTLMKYLFLWLVPAMAECLTVCIIFATYFAYLPLALTVFYFVFLYVLWTILVTLWRKKFRKALVQSDNGTCWKCVESKCR